MRLLSSTGHLHLIVLFALLPACSLLSAQAPAIDYHQHLFSPEAAALVTGRPGTLGLSARDVVALLDSAGIQRALVLSTAYTWSKASRAPVADEYEHVKAKAPGSFVIRSMACEAHATHHS